MADTVNRGNSPGDPLADTLYEAFGKVNTAFDNKVDKVAGKGLSEVDLTSTKAAQYDTAYTHSQSAHAPSNAQKNSDITKSEIEDKLTGDINSHGHNADREKAQSEVKSIVVKTGNFTLSLVEGGAYIRSTATSGITCTVPANSSVAFPLGTVITIRQAASGQVTCIGAAGVTLNGRTKTSDIHRSIQVTKVDTNTWDVEGGDS